MKCCFCCCCCYYCYCCCSCSCCCFYYCYWSHKPTFKVWLKSGQEQLRYWWHWVCGGGGPKSFSCKTQLLSWVVVELVLWQLFRTRTPITSDSFNQPPPSSVWSSWSSTKPKAFSLFLLKQSIRVTMPHNSSTFEFNNNAGYISSKTFEIVKMYARNSQILK